MKEMMFEIEHHQSKIWIQILILSLPRNNLEKSLCNISESVCTHSDNVFLDFEKD